MGDAATAAVLPILVSGEAIGTLVVWDPEPSEWTRSRRELLTGLAAQGGQAIARAQAYDEQVNAANTLQESLLPSRLPVRRDVSLAAGTSLVRAACASEGTGTTAWRSASGRSPWWSATSWARACTPPR